MSTRNRFPIEHVIVLMLENRSYDHMLGYLPNGHGLAGDEFNLVDPSDPTSERVRVSNRTGYVTAVDPAHDFVSVEKQLFGEPGNVVNPAPMSRCASFDLLALLLTVCYHSYQVQVRKWGKVKCEASMF